MFPYQLNSEDRAEPPGPVATLAVPPSALAGAILTDSFLVSPGAFFCSAGVELFFGEGFGVVFVSASFFGLALGVGFAVGLTDGFGGGVRLGFGGGVVTGDGEGVAMGS